jgi:hypothetical protein
MELSKTAQYHRNASAIDMPQAHRNPDGICNLLEQLIERLNGGMSAANRLSDALDPVLQPTPPLAQTKEAMMSSGLSRTHDQLLMAISLAERIITSVDDINRRFAP